MMDLPGEEVLSTLVNEYGEDLAIVVSRDEGRGPWLLLIHSDIGGIEHPVSVGDDGVADDVILNAEETLWVLTVAKIWEARQAVAARR